MADSVGTTTYSYDALSRPLVVTNAFSRAVQYGYEDRGLRRFVVDPDGGRQTLVYDGNQRLLSAQNAQGALHTFTYDNADRRIGVRYGDSTNATYTYDAAGQVTTIAHSYVASSGPKYEYLYDAVGNRIVYTDGTVRTTYSYDVTNQLIQEKGSGNPTTHTYDPVGNRLVTIPGTTATTYTYDAANQLQTAMTRTGQTTTYTYDGAGNLFTTKIFSGVLTTFTWDAENRLLGTAALNNVYDGDGRRVQRGSGAAIRQLTFDGNNVLAEHESGGTVHAVNFFDPQQYGLLLSAFYSNNSGTFSNGPRYMHVDALGSIRLTTSTGSQLGTAGAYPGFGSTNGLTIDSSPNPFGWIGQFGYYNDSKVGGLQYLLADERWYDPQTARWISVDPIEYLGGDSNLYRYVLNNPINAIDPSGTVIASGKSGCGKVSSTGIKGYARSIQGCIAGPAYFYLEAADGTTYEGSTSAQLIAALQKVNDAKGTLTVVILKGHGNSEGIYDSDSNPFIEYPNGAADGRYEGPNGQQPIGPLLKSITGNGTAISLRGCNTSSAAQSLASELGNGTVVSGAPIPIFSIPYTKCVVGPWWNY